MGSYCVCLHPPLCAVGSTCPGCQRIVLKEYYKGITGGPYRYGYTDLACYCNGVMLVRNTMLRVLKEDTPDGAQPYYDKSLIEVICPVHRRWEIKLPEEWYQIVKSKRS